MQEENLQCEERKSPIGSPSLLRPVLLAGRGQNREHSEIRGILTGEEDPNCTPHVQAAQDLNSLLRIMGKLGAAGGRLTSSGLESGIVDGESPSISLSYIDGTGYKCTNTCVYMLSTESVCQQLGSCLMARYLTPTFVSSPVELPQTGEERCDVPGHEGMATPSPGGQTHQAKEIGFAREGQSTTDDTTRGPTAQTNVIDNKRPI